MTENIRLKAEQLIASKGYLISLQQEGYDWYWYVPSQSEPGRFYKIPFDGSDCQCAYHEHSYKDCTHMIAAQIVRVRRARWEHQRRKREGLEDLRPQTKRELQAIAQRLGV